MTRHVPRRLTGAALLLVLTLTLYLVPAPAGAAERVEAWNEPATEQPMDPRTVDEGLVAWLLDTWNQLQTVFTGALRGGGNGPDGGDRGSGMDPNGHDHHAFQK